MPRSVWKGPYCDNSVIKKVNRSRDLVKYGKKNIAAIIIKIRSRASCILPIFIGYTFAVYNGKKYIPVKVNSNMVGRKFGEFSPTRIFTGHSGDKKAVRKK